MIQLQIIHEQEVLTKKFKVYGSPENPLFLAKDVADWIEHSNTRMMLKSVDDEEKVVNNVYTLGGTQESWFLTEDGLYEVLMQSRKPIAKQFKKQIKNILKEIRLNGGYIATNENDDDASIMAKALLIANKTIENNKRKIVEQQLLMEAQKPKVLFAEAIQASHTSILVGEFAKILKQNGVDVGQKRLFEWLREMTGKGQAYFIKKFLSKVVAI